jgi:HSP20 family protein
MYESLLNFPGTLFSDFERLRRDFEQAFDTPGLPAGMPASIRAVAPGSFPALNVGTTPGSVEVYAFAPGLEPNKLEVTVDRGVLTIAGERPAPADGEKSNVYSRERLFGKFKRAISLPEDVDPERINASYRDGLLQVSIARREAAQPKRITVQ